MPVWISYTKAYDDLVERVEAGFETDVVTFFCTGTVTVSVLVVWLLAIAAG